MLAAVSGGFALLLAAARVAGDAAIAGPRVATIAMARDCFEGCAMARVMSIAFMMFMVVPVIAWAFGRACSVLNDRRAIFWVAAVAVAVLAWFAARMPETVAYEDRLSLSPRRAVHSYGVVLADRLSLGYTAAGSLVGALYGYFSSVHRSWATPSDDPGRPPSRCCLSRSPSAAAVPPGLREPHRARAVRIGKAASRGTGVSGDGWTSGDRHGPRRRRL